MSPIKVAIVGISGYTGMELLRLLSGHPGFEIQAVTSRKEQGKTIEQLFPHFQGTKYAQLTISPPEPAALAQQCSLAFLAVPHGTAMALAGELVDRGKKVVDLSADFRLNSQTTYEQWYQVAHTRPAMLSSAVYGLPELYAEQIKSANLVANPGCYPTSIILGLYPALSNGLTDPQEIIIDSKSGATGAGRKPALGTLFCEVQDSFRAYNLGKHRHTPEIEQELSKIAGQDLLVSFNPHLLPINRGIISTCYARLSSNISLDEIQACYKEKYRHSPWVRILPPGKLPDLASVRGTMFCDLGLVKDQRTGRLIIVSAIDNLCRGASGQAVANANLMTGQGLEMGLTLLPLRP